MVENELILEVDGRKRKHVEVVCLTCGTKFPKQKRFLKRYPRHYCGLSCSAKANRKSVTIKCAVCGKSVKKAPSKANSKTGLVFCSRGCKELAQSRKGGRMLRCGGGDMTPYRIAALEHYGEKCEWCGCNVRGLLDAHHIDHDRANGDIQNLIVLCVLCHALETRGYVTIDKRLPLPITDEGIAMVELLRTIDFIGCGLVL